MHKIILSFLVDTGLMNKYVNLKIQIIDMAGYNHRVCYVNDYKYKEFLQFVVESGAMSRSFYNEKIL